MRKLSVGLAALSLVATSCMGGGGAQRSVFVDYNHDEFASIMLENFPKQVTVTPGDTIVFRQIWTGEPHTVTGGTLVNEELERTRYLVPFGEAYDQLRASGVGLPDPEGDLPEGKWADMIELVERSKREPAKTWIESYEGLRKQGLKIPPVNDPGDASIAEVVREIDKEFVKVFESGEGLPFALEEIQEGGYGVSQNAGQPCYLDEGGPPKEDDEPCPEDKQQQPAFNGKQSYYNSGIIPYEGPQGNTFRVELDPEIEPGSYMFYCAVHGAFQATEVKVAPEGSDVPSQEEVSRQARKEIAEFSAPMLETFRDARDGKIEIDGETVEAPFGGLSPPVHGGINEFLPKTIQTKVGDKVTWKLMGWDHSVSFNVPRYFPVIRFAENGTISLNPRLDPPAGGSPKLPERKEGEIVRVDGGTYDGTGFWSSGMISSEPYAEYSLRFSKPGTYKYACLLHPPMVGSVEVTR